ncbi:gliding motility-associated C-terminal domain-containing protein, partial [Flavobacterium terrae]
LDNIAPTFTAPANTTIYADAQCNYDASVQVVGDVTDEADNCSTGLQATYTDSVADGACQGSHIITRTWSLVDNCGNQAATQTQTITVLDNIAPTFTAPANTTIYADAQCNYDASVQVVGDVTDEADNCSTGLQATYTDSVADGACQGSHIITRTWALVDNCGNQAATQTQTITVLDNIAPTFTAPANTTIYADAQCNYDASVQVVGDVTDEADNCSTGLQATYTDSVADGACQGSHIITRTWSLVDNCGNQAATQTQTITVLDNIAPTFTAPANTTIYADAQCNYDASVQVVGDVTDEADNCSTGLQATYTDSVADGACQGSHIITRTWSLVDNCGNQAATQTQTITVLDNIAPTFTAPANTTIYADAQCNYDASVQVVGDVTDEADNCSTGLQATYTDSVADGACQGSHIITRTWSLVDNCGNQAATQTQTITVLDNIAPTLIGEFETSISVSCSNIPSDEPQFQDGCSGVTVIASPENNTPVNETDYGYVLNQQWIATDACGNQTVVIRTINVTINEPFENIFVEGPVCTDGGPVDLFSYLDPSIDQSGTWVDVNNSGGLSGSILDPMGIIAGVYKYRYIISTGTCPRLIEVILTIKDDCIVLPCSISDIKISKVVTPNNDGYNDTFFIGGTEECGFKYNVKIFNRWGALVYENPNYKNDWDGKAKSAISSSNLPAGSYYYIVDIVDSGLDVFTGYIYLGTKN